MKTLQTLAYAAASALIALAASPASAALYTTTLGTALATTSNCDDCFDGPIAFGNGQTINFFGTVYSSLYVGSNGYVTFGGGASQYTTIPLDTQNIAPMIAGSFTDLWSFNDAASGVYANTNNAGELIVTWSQMGHFNDNYAHRSTFQLVIRSDQFAIAQGEGQIGFFYDQITDPYATSAGFGDGLSQVNPGEVAFASNVAGTSLSNVSSRFFNLSNGAPTVVEPAAVPEPESIALLGLGALGLLLVRRRRHA